MYNAWHKNIDPALEKHYKKIENILRDLKNVVDLSFRVIDVKSILKKLSAPQNVIDKIWDQYLKLKNSNISDLIESILYI